MTMSELHDREAGREATGNYHRGGEYTIPGPRSGPACMRDGKHDWRRFDLEAFDQAMDAEGWINVPIPGVTPESYTSCASCGLRR